MSDKSTPRPWKAYGYTIGDPADFGRAIADFYGAVGRSMTERKANAELALVAVNQYEHVQELVRTVEQAIEDLAGEQHDESELNRALGKNGAVTIGNLRAALAHFKEQ